MTYYIRTKVSLKFGQIAGYSEMMAKLVPFVERHGWKLVFGLQPFIGDLAILTLSGKSRSSLISNGR